MSHKWYVLRSKPRSEEALWRQVCRRGFESFFPRLRVTPVNPRAKRSRPYFPGYMFVRLDIGEVGMSAFEWMPYSLGLVRFGGEPATVQDELIISLMQHINEFNVHRMEPALKWKHGDTIWIDDGPFAGYEGIFDAQIQGRERVRILLQLLGGRQVRVELNADQIEQSQRS